MKKEILKLKRTSSVINNIEVGKRLRVRTPEKDIFDVKITSFNEEFVEMEILNQVVDVGNGQEMLFFGGTIKINATEIETGNCPKYPGHEVEFVHKILNNVPSDMCEVEGKQYKTCEEGCPIWKQYV